MANNTTAGILGAYRRELEAERFDPEQVRQLVTEAARTLLRDDPLIVSPKSTKTYCAKRGGIVEQPHDCNGGEA